MQNPVKLLQKLKYGGTAMIRITNIRNLKQNDGSENWAIVRSMKNPSTWIKQVDILSPSKDLFYKYLDLKKKGQWNQESFDDIYVPQFLYEMRTSACETLNTVYTMDKNGAKISMACFCTDELCHRYIVAGLLQGAGCNVVTDTGKDYSKYFEMYKNILQGGY